MFVRVIKKVEIFKAWQYIPGHDLPSFVNPPTFQTREATEEECPPVLGRGKGTWIYYSRPWVKLRDGNTCGLLDHDWVLVFDDGCERYQESEFNEKFSIVKPESTVQQVKEI
ncbi:MAG: hypothetical protein KGN01_06265 [Patescibacteria group bacterium]|nr:hypothetical protein [Patescibacteria group bacterium]